MCFERLRPCTQQYPGQSHMHGQQEEGFCQHGKCRGRWRGRSPSAIGAGCIACGRNLPSRLRPGLGRTGAHPTHTSRTARRQVSGPPPAASDERDQSRQPTFSPDSCHLHHPVHVQPLLIAQTSDRPRSQRTVGTAAGRPQPGPHDQVMRHGHLPRRTHEPSCRRRQRARRACVQVRAHIQNVASPFGETGLA